MKISIIVPTFNRADLIGQTIESVLAQSCDDWELVIVDDHSTDETEEIVNGYRLKDSRIRFARRSSPTKGAPACRNEGVRASAGELLVFLDSDDLLAPHCVDRRLRFMAEHPKVDLLVNQAEFFQDHPGDAKLLVNRFDYDNDLDRFLMNDNIWLINMPTWRREAFERIGPWDESLPCWQDWEQHVRALAKGVTYRKLDEVDSFIRLSHSRQAISNAAKMVSPDYVRGALAATVRVRETLHAAGLDTPYRQGLLAFNVFELLHGLARAKRNRAARRLAREARRHGVFSRQQCAHCLVHSLLLSGIQLLERGAEWWEERLHREARALRPEKLRGRGGAGRMQNAECRMQNAEERGAKRMQNAECRMQKSSELGA